MRSPFILSVIAPVFGAFGAYAAALNTSSPQPSTITRLQGATLSPNVTTAPSPTSTIPSKGKPAAKCSEDKCYLSIQHMFKGNSQKVHEYCQEVAKGTPLTDLLGLDCVSYIQVQQSCNCAAPTAKEPGTVNVNIDVSATIDVKFVILGGGASCYFPDVCATCGYFRVVFEDETLLKYRIEACSREERNTVIVKVGGVYKYLKCEGDNCTKKIIGEAGKSTITQCSGDECQRNLICRDGDQCKYERCSGDCFKYVSCTGEKCTTPTRPRLPPPPKPAPGGPAGPDGPAGPRGKDPGACPKNSGSPKRALYFLESHPEGASIVSVPIGDDGSLDNTTVVRTPTGGRGMIGRDMNGPVPNDPLFSQDSVLVTGNRLFTVNAGSNTVSQFYISGNDSLHPALLGEPVSTVGDYPNSVAYSEKNKLACVTTTGKKAGVQCYSVPECGRLNPVGSFMPLPINQTTPPLGPVNTVSDIVFNPSETALFVSIKGNGMSVGYLYAYKVADGKIDPKPVVSRPPELLVPFSLTFLTAEAAVITDPSYGASYLSIARNLSATVSNKVTIPNQGASCWSVYSHEFEAVYVLDGTSPNVHTLDPRSGRIKYVIPGEKRSTGSFDATVDRSSLYVLQGSPGVAVFDLKGAKSGGSVPRLSQYLDLSSLGDRSAWTGMAVYSG